MTFYIMFVYIIFSSGWIAEWPSFGKELLTRLTICSPCILTICFGLILIAPVTGHCILVTSVISNRALVSINSDLLSHKS